MFVFPGTKQVKESNRPPVAVVMGAIGLFRNAIVSVPLYYFMMCFKVVSLNKSSSQESNKVTFRFRWLSCVSYKEDHFSVLQIMGYGDLKEAT